MSFATAADRDDTSARVQWAGSEGEREKGRKSGRGKMRDKQAPFESNDVFLLQGGE